MTLYPHTDYYVVLGLKESASEEEIKRAYHELARKHHPDADPGTTGDDSRFKEINEAYSVLTDPEKRAQYDARKARQPGRSRQGYGPTRASHVSRPRAASGTANRRFTDAGEVRSRQSGRSHGAVVDLNLSVTGLSLGLRIVDNLIGGLDRVLSSSERATFERPSPRKPQPDTDRSRQHDDTGNQGGSDD